MNTTERQTKLQDYTTRIVVWYDSLPSETSGKKSGDRVLKPILPAPGKFTVAPKIPLNQASDFALKQIGEGLVLPDTLLDLQFFQAANFLKG